MGWLLIVFGLLEAVFPLRFGIGQDGEILAFQEHETVTVGFDVFPNMGGDHKAAFFINFAIVLSGKVAHG
jgi:hypothetical protein